MWKLFGLYIYKIILWKLGLKPLEKQAEMASCTYCWTSTHSIFSHFWIRVQKFYLKFENILCLTIFDCIYNISEYGKHRFLYHWAFMASFSSWIFNMANLVSTLICDILFTRLIPCPTSQSYLMKIVDKLHRWIYSLMSYIDIFLYDVKI